MAGERQRLDLTLEARGLMPSRARARDAIQRGTVTVNGEVVQKASLLVGAADEVAVADPAARYVSRAALKLIAGLDAGRIDVAGRVCLDVGASTGGFTQVLLERGAERVYAVDVGHGQLHPDVAADARVVSLEGATHGTCPRGYSRADRSARLRCELCVRCQGPRGAIGAVQSWGRRNHPDQAPIRGRPGACRQGRSGAGPDGCGESGGGRGRVRFFARLEPPPLNPLPDHRWRRQPGDRGRLPPELTDRQRALGCAAKRRGKPAWTTCSSTSPTAQSSIRRRR